MIDQVGWYSFLVSIKYCKSHQTHINQHETNLNVIFVSNLLTLKKLISALSVLLATFILRSLKNTNFNTF